MSSLAKAAFAAALGWALAAPVGVATAQSDADAFLRLPTQEIEGAQIGWYFDSLEAFTHAVETTRPMIVVFGDQTSSSAQGFAQHVAPCPQLNQLAGVAVFAYGDPTHDEYARRMASHLKLTVYPTISVIAPRTDFLQELYRMEGFFDATAVAHDLHRLLVQQNYWPADRPPPAPLPTHYLAYPNLACTRQGAEHLGLVPAPQ